MPVAIQRYKKSTYVSKRRKLPEQLEFLKGTNYFVIAEHKEGKRKQYFVEFRPKSIKNIIAKVKNVQVLRTEADKLREIVKKLEQDNDALKAKDVLNQKVIKLLQSENEKNKNSKMNPRLKSPESFYSIMEKKGFQMTGPPIQGGLPSLGKKK